MKGWECPKCSRVYSPSVDECKTCNEIAKQATPTWIPNDGTGMPPYPIMYPHGPSQPVPCLMEEFFKNNPGQQVAQLYCSCPKCSPRC